VATLSPRRIKNGNSPASLTQKPHENFQAICDVESGKKKQIYLNPDNEYLKDK